jgi:large subunit ribosomal protein L18
MKNLNETRRLKRKKRIHMRLQGTSERPRLIIHRSIKNLAASLIDDVAKKILLSCSTRDKEIKAQFSNAGNVKAASFFGEVFARKAKEKGIAKIVFDRAGYLYHGRIKAFAENARKSGLQF